MNKSVENLLLASHEVLSSMHNPSASLTNGTYCESVQDASSADVNDKGSQNLGTNASPKSSFQFPNKRDHKDNKDHCVQNGSENLSYPHKDTSSFTKPNDQQSQDIVLSSSTTDLSKHSSFNGKKVRDRIKKKSWYTNILSPTYKSRSDNFKRIFKDVPDEERLVVDYSCALQREIIVHGRLYVSQNYLSFYANIFMWETLVSFRWKDVTSITKEKTALVIPNAILIHTSSEKFFFTSFYSRDKTYMMLFQVWQSALMGQSMSMTEMWQFIHDRYGKELGLTSDDEDYISSLSLIANGEKMASHLSLESVSKVSGDAEVEHGAIDIQEDSCSHEESYLLNSSRTKRPEKTIDALHPSDSDDSKGEQEQQGSRISTAVCTSLHNGRLLVNTTLPIHIDQLFTLLFTTSKFFLDFHTARKTTDLTQTSWIQDANGRKTRSVSLTVLINRTVGPKSSQVTEVQVMLPCSTPGRLYCIDVETTNAGIPYGDSFSVQTHYCLTAISENESSFAVFAELKYKKNVWGLVKNFIEKNCWSGMQEYLNSLIKALSIECEENDTTAKGLKQKSRRRRITTVTGGSTIQTHSPDHTALHQAPVEKIPHTRNIVNVPDLHGENSVILSWIFLIAVLCLIAVNGLMYYKLSSFETPTYTVTDLHVLKNTPKTEEDWMNLLQQQESLHTVEIKKWQRILHTAVQLIKQTEESLTQLQMSVHPTATEKIFSVLKPGLKAHNSQNDLHHDSKL